MAGKEAPSITDLQKGAFKAGGPTRNAGGGHYNHALFWKTMGPAKESGSPSPALAKAIDEAFGSMDEMKAKFNAAATGQFGSGWSWLGVQADGKLAVVGTPNQDNPLMEGATATPMNVILGCDVWEHAYYLKYQNRRPEYVENWWNVVNWGYVSEIYDKYASKGMPVPVEG
uniref:superoxide dismutase n=1 Tax=Fibrocapsa japonica TaxID=94617 RepID=A0A7S2XZ78_9STRA|mmetsp:Transcript_14971/g.22091  ORF Transcript_14971/g.22091 Transcript_14971/m.22091 type:complete len:171 (+) Transcript_14971:1-513(+)